MYTRAEVPFWSGAWPIPMKLELELRVIMSPSWEILLSTRAAASPARSAALGTARWDDSFLGLQTSCTLQMRALPNRGSSLPVQSGAQLESGWSPSHCGGAGTVHASCQGFSRSHPAKNSWNSGQLVPSSWARGRAGVESSSMGKSKWAGLPAPAWKFSTLPPPLSTESVDGTRTPREALNQNVLPCP